MSQPPCVVIVNYNSGEALLACLAALDVQTRQYDVVVVDNASTDGSARRAHDAFPRVRLYPLRHNTGFARGFNIGVSHAPAGCGVVVALNPDTVPRPDFLEHLVAPFDADPTIGSVAGTLTFATVPDRIASAGIAVHRNGVAIDARLGERVSGSDMIVDVFGASGGAAAFRLSAYQSAGGFFDPYFMYLEDVDLAWRLRLCGWRSVWSPAAVATHEYSLSAGEGSSFKRRLLARNRLWTLARCLPGELWRRDRRAILGFDLFVLAHAVATRDTAVLRGRAEGLAAMPLRLHEGTRIKASASVSWMDLTRWIKPAIGPGELLRMRRLTKRLARSAEVVKVNLPD